MNPPRARRLPAVLLTLAAGAMLVACEGGPAAPAEAPEADALLDEPALEAAGTEVTAMVEALFQEAERERDRQRRSDRNHRGPDLDRARLAVVLGGSAVDLASRLLEGQGGGDAEQLRLLDRAAELQQHAVAALQGGHAARATALARRACLTALKAVVLPGGVTLDEARAIHRLAGALLEEARAAVDPDDPTQVMLLRWAGRMYASGSRGLEAGSVRAVAVLWKSAVISAHLAG